MSFRRRTISPERKTIYYTGTALMIVGAILFLSVFVSGIANFGNFDDFQGRVRAEGFRGLAGFLLIGIGQFLRVVGARGAAGAGVVLDPERARRDVEPWSRMAGGMVQDALDEAGLDVAGQRGPALPFDEQLRRLHQLHQDGLLTKDEYEREKGKLLDRQ